MTRKLGIARSVDFTSAGIHRQYVMLAHHGGKVEKLGRGLYRLPGVPDHPHSRLIQICKRVPRGVVCLHSALFFHGLIETAPEENWVALDRKEWLPSTAGLPVKFVRFSGDAMTQGVVNLKLQGVPVRVYSPMKTVADLLKYRKQLGPEVAIAALRASICTNQYSPYRLLHFARICRVEKIVNVFIREVGSGREFKGRQARSAWRERL